MNKKIIIAAVAAVVAVILLVSVCLLNNGLFLKKTEKEIVVSTGMTDTQVI